MNDPKNAVAKFSEIRSGEMKEVSVGESRVLLARVGDKCYAVGAHCTHYGAPLAEGALVGNRIICPWHHACFDAGSGDLEEPPALDSLPNYAVRIDGENIFVEFSEPAVDRRTPKMTSADPLGDKRCFVILGGGAAGYAAAQTLREDGFAGRLVMISREERVPYDRPNLSKDYLHGHAEAEWMPLRSDEFLASHGIEFERGREVKAIDSERKAVIFSDGDEIAFDRLLIATGGTPRNLDLPNSNLKNIFVLRSFDDADSIIAVAKSAKRAVIVGASFIAMETASSLRQLGLDVTVVAPDKVPFEKTLGSEIGELFQAVHEKQGVVFRLNSKVVGFEGQESLSAVVLGSGERLEADLVILGVGVVPATKQIAGLELHQDGGVIADSHLRIADHIYAAGDIVHFPDPRTGEMVRIEHWRTALQQGRIAAHNMAGKRMPFSAVPFFWTTQFDTTLNYVGHTTGWDEIIFRGSVERKDFLAFYVKDFKVLAIAGMNRDRELAYLEEFLRLNLLPSLAAIRDESYDFSQPMAAGQDLSQSAIF